MKKRTKTEMVKRLLERGGTITSWQAITRYKATRLSGIIYSLKKQGMKIISEPVTRDGVTFARYKKAA